MQSAMRACHARSYVHVWRQAPLCTHMYMSRPSLHASEMHAPIIMWPARLPLGRKPMQVGPDMLYVCY